MILYFQAKCISSFKCYSKLCLFLASILQIYISSKYGENNLRSDIGNIIEYSMTYTLLGFIYLIGKDC